MKPFELTQPVAGQPGIVVGRVVRTEVLKQLMFAWCWQPPALVQCVVPHGAGPRPRVGSFARFVGSFREYGGHRTDCLPVELTTEQVEVLTVPTVQHPGQGLDGLSRSRALFARATAITTAETFLSHAGLLRVEAPVVVGPEAAAGSTTPFRLCAGRQHAYLAVSGIVGLHDYLAGGLGRVYQMSRLFWGHHSSDRSFLTEINLIEFALAGGGRRGVIALAERLIEAIRISLSQVPALGNPAILGIPLTGLPVLTHAELISRTAAMANSAPEAAGHVVPRAAARAITSELGTPGFWLLDPPASTTPHYVRSVPGMVGPRSVAVDLHLAGVGESASGSEWIIDPAQARAVTADWPDQGAAASYLAAVDRGIPDATAAISIGVDRLLMYLLGLSQVAAVVPAVRNSATFRTATSHACAGSTTAKIIPPAAPSVRSVTTGARRIAHAVDWLLANGFVECMTSLLSEPWAERLGAHLPVVDYFGRRACLVPRREPAHHRYLSECPARIFEIGPVARGGGHWASPAWTLTASFIDPEQEQLEAVAERLLSILTGDDSAAGSNWKASMTPMRPGHPGYFRGSLTGRSLTAVTWSVDGRLVADAGIWIAAASDLADAFGDEATLDLASLREFLESEPPPAGSITVHLTALPSLGWPSFAVGLEGGGFSTRH
jgi:aspartyl/asparaginyl-tRNA synthetase